MKPETLALVHDERAVAGSHHRFIKGIRDHVTLARDLVRRTRYWVYDPATKTFSPSIFTAYDGMDFVRYSAIRDGAPVSGDKFDGGLTQRALAAILGAYRADALLARELDAWVAVQLGAQALEGITADKWRFARLTGHGAGLVGLVGGWEGSEELVETLGTLRRSPGRTPPLEP